MEPTQPFSRTVPQVQEDHTRLKVLLAILILILIGSAIWFAMLMKQSKNAQVFEERAPVQQVINEQESSSLEQDESYTELNTIVTTDSEADLTDIDSEF